MLYAYRAAADAFTSTAEEREKEPESWWASRLVDPAGLSVAFGAFDGGELFGAVTINFNERPKTRHKALLVGMFVRESARDRGVGKALVEAALGAARHRPDTRVVTLTATEGNDPAIRLYESCGFQVFGIEPLPVDAHPLWIHIGSMTVTLTIKKVPVTLARELRRRAAAHHRSLQGELLRLLEDAAAEPISAVREPAATFKLAAPAAVTSEFPMPERRLTLAEAWERSRRIMASAESRAPSGESADIVRRDRDAREMSRQD